MTRTNSATAQRSLVRSERAISSSIAASPSAFCGTAQSFCHQERDEPEDGGVAEFVEAGTQEPQSDEDIATLDDEQSLKAAATGAPKGQCILGRMVEQRCAVMFCRIQITGQQRERARRVGQSQT